MSGRDVNSPVIGSRVTVELDRAGVRKLAGEMHFPTGVESRDLRSARERREGSRDMVVGG